MKKLTLEKLEKDNLLIYKYIRGSHSHGISTPESDTDEGGCYITPIENLVDLGLDYQSQVADDKNDKVYYEIGKFMQLLIKSNPTILESLFIDDEFVLYEHPIMTEIKKHRDKFVTQACFNAATGYAKSQIQKATGYNKKCVNPVTKRLQPLDFAYTFRKQGSTKIEYWLEHRGLYQKYCGLVNIPNMDAMYGVFYDWGNHFLNEEITYLELEEAFSLTNEDDTVSLIHKLKNTENLSEQEKQIINLQIKTTQLGNMARFICEFYNVNFEDESFYNWYVSQKPIGYKGMVGEDGMSNELRLSSIEKDELPICQMHYDVNKYSSHCRQYREYQEWLENRNEARFESNKGKTYDAKNICECFRLINMCIEIANGEGVKVNRKNIDREFLLDIKKHKYSYEELMRILQEKNKIMEIAIKNSKLPKDVDVKFINELLLNIRKWQITNKNGL